MAGFVYEEGEAIDVGIHGDHSYVYAGGDPVPDTGGSSLVFESGTGLGGGLDEWITSGQGATNRSQCKDNFTRTEPTVQWSTYVPSYDSSQEAPTSNLVVDDTYLYGQTGESTVYCMRRDNGNLVWDFDAPDDENTEPRGQCYLNRTYGYFIAHYSWDAQKVVAYHTDGSGIAWTWNTPNSPTTGNFLYPYYMSGDDEYLCIHCGTASSSEGDALYVLDPSDGSVRWYEADNGDEAAFGAPAVDPLNDRVVWGSVRMWDRRLSDGYEHGVHDNNKVAHGHISIYWPYIYINEGINEAYLTKIDLRDHSQVWKHYYSDGEPDITGPAVTSDGKHIFAGSRFGDLTHRLDDGTEVWTQDIGGNINEPPAISADGKTVIAAPGNIKAYDTDTGNQLWVYGNDSGENVDSTAPICYGNRGVYFHGPNNGQISFMK